MTVTIVKGTGRVGERRKVGRANTDTEWLLRSVCRLDVRYTDGPFGDPHDPTRIARQLAHRCRAHCPVVEACAADLLAQRPARPRRAVRAGVWFNDKGKPAVLPDSRCGEHCAGLPAVHRKAVAR